MYSHITANLWNPIDCIRQSSDFSLKGGPRSRQIFARKPKPYNLSSEIVGMHHESSGTNSVNKSSIAVYLQRLSFPEGLHNRTTRQIRHVRAGAQDPVTDSVWWRVEFARPPLHRIAETSLRLKSPLKYGFQAQPNVMRYARPSRIADLPLQLPN